MSAHPTLKMLAELPEGRNPRRPRYIAYFNRRLREMIDSGRQAYKQGNEAKLKGVLREYDDLCGSPEHAPAILEYLNGKLPKGGYTPIVAVTDILERAAKVDRESIRRYRSCSRKLGTPTPDQAKVRREGVYMKMRWGSGKTYCASPLVPEVEVPEYFDSLMSWIRSATPGARLPRRLVRPYNLDIISQLWDERVFRRRGKNTRSGPLRKVNAFLAWANKFRKSGEFESSLTSDA